MMQVFHDIALLEPESAPTHYPSHTLELSGERLDVLLIEDADADALLTRIALEETKIPFVLTRLRRGDEVFYNLARMLKPVKKPDLILLDLGLPGMDGFDVLEEIAQMRADIRDIPIAILTAHQHFDYICSTYPYLNIVGYLNKPCSMEEMRTMLTRARPKFHS